MLIFERDMKNFKSNKREYKLTSDIVMLIATIIMVFTIVLVDSEVDTNLIITSPINEYCGE